MSHTLLAVRFMRVLALDARGQLFAYGTNDYGQCGTGDREYVLEPVQVALPEGCGRVTSIAMTRTQNFLVRGERLLASGGLFYQITPTSPLFFRDSFGEIAIPGRVLRWVRAARNVVVIGVDDDLVYACGRIKGIFDDKVSWTCISALCGRAIDHLAVGVDIIIFCDAARHWWWLGAHSPVGRPARLFAFEEACIEYISMDDYIGAAVSADRDLYTVHPGALLRDAVGGYARRPALVHVPIHARRGVGGGGSAPGAPLRIVDFSVCKYCIYAAMHDGSLRIVEDADPHDPIVSCFGVRARATAVACTGTYGAPDLLFADDSGKVRIFKYCYPIDSFDVIPPERVRALDGLLESSIRPRGPHTLIEMAAQRVRARDIERAAAHGLAGGGLLVPPHMLRYVRRIVRARRMAGGGDGE